jgi:hypothetical protein
VGGEHDPGPVADLLGQLVERRDEVDLRLDEAGVVVVDADLVELGRPSPTSARASARFSRYCRQPEYDEYAEVTKQIARSTPSSRICAACRPASGASCGCPSRPAGRALGGEQRLERGLQRPVLVVDRGAATEAT